MSNALFPQTLLGRGLRVHGQLGIIGSVLVGAPLLLVSYVADGELHYISRTRPELEALLLSPEEQAAMERRISDEAQRSARDGEYGMNAKDTLPALLRSVDGENVLVARDGQRFIVLHADGERTIAPSSIRPVASP